jgi:acyl dehydratase
VSGRYHGAEDPTGAITHVHRREKGVSMTAEQVPGLSYDESVIGQEVEVGSFTVTAEQIAAYCEAVGETSPLHTDPEAAAKGPFGALTAPAGLVHAVELKQGLDAKVQFPGVAFHAGERIETFAPIRVGDTLTAYNQVKEVYAKTGRTGSMVFEVRRTEFRNQGGDPVVATETSFVRREV